MCRQYATMPFASDCILILCSILQASHGFKFNVRGRVDFGEGAPKALLEQINKHLKEQKQAQHPPMHGPIPYRMLPAMAGSPEEAPAFDSREIQRWLTNGHKYEIPRLGEPRHPSTLMQQISGKDLRQFHLFDTNPQHDGFLAKQAPKNFIDV